jgi:cytochrome P450
MVKDYFGVPTGETHLFEWFDAVSTYVFMPDVLQKKDTRDLATSAGAEIGRYLEGPVRASFQEPPGASDTVLHRLAHDQSPQRLAPDRVRDTVAGTITGTLIPTFQEFVQVIDVLLDLPVERFRDVQTIARSRREDLLWPTVLEAARFSPRPPLLARECVRPTAIRGRRVRQQTVVFTLPITAAFDWTVAPRPWRFLAERPPAAYPIFGHGQHHCVGATRERPIAQILITCLALHLLALPGLRRARGPLGRAGLLGSRLFVEWD